MKLSVLDIFVLSMLDRGAETPYDLHRSEGLSLGASLPSLKRLKSEGFVTVSRSKSSKKRPRHQYRLTESGTQQARNAWKSYLSDAASNDDLDSILRIVDLAVYYQADKRKIKRF